MNTDINVVGVFDAKKKTYRIIYIIIKQNEIKYRKSTPLAPATCGR